MCAMSRDTEGSSSRSASGRSTPQDSEECDPKRNGNAGGRQTPDRDSSRKSRKTKQLRRLLPADRIPRSIAASRPMLPPAVLSAKPTNGTTTHMNILDFSTPDDDLFNPVHPPSSFPPVPYPQNSHPEYTYSHRRHHSGRMRPDEKWIMSTRLDRIESAIKGYMVERGQQALRRSELPELNTHLSETQASSSSSSTRHSPNGRSPVLEKAPNSDVDSARRTL